MPVFIDGKEMSPCICAQVRFALGITQRQPTNQKTCSTWYWNRIVYFLGRGLPPAQIQAILQ